MAGSPDNHVAAVTLLIPWMDRLYTLESGGSSKGRTKQVVAHFFPQIGGYELGRMTGFVIDLKPYWIRPEKRPPWLILYKR